MPDSDLGFVNPITQNRIDERNLVRRLLEQRSEAWCEFVIRYQHLICARVRRVNEEFRLGLVEPDCEDVCAEVFSGLLENDMSALRSFQYRCRISTWLSVIARRATLRKIQKRTTPQASADLSECQVNTAFQNSLQRLVAAEEIEQLNANLSKLKTTDRQVLELFYKQELSYQQIGQTLGISTNAVGPKIHRAEKRLKKLLRTQ